MKWLTIRPLLLTEDIVQDKDSRQAAWWYPPGKSPQSEDEAKFGQGAELKEMAMGRCTPAYRSIEEETIEADPPEVAEMKKVQEDPKARAELFKDLPPAIKAQAKEEFGDYYIDPSTGYAINLKSLRKSQKRREHMDVIKHFPESLKGQQCCTSGDTLTGKMCQWMRGFSWTSRNLVLK